MAEVSERQRRMAEKCRQCKICNYARKKQKGIIYNLVKLESKICPFCRAYEKVYGRKAYESANQ